MLWKRATPERRFLGLLTGTFSSIGCGCGSTWKPSALRYIALFVPGQAMAENMFRALWAWLICVVVTGGGEHCSRGPNPSRS